MMATLLARTKFENKPPLSGSILLDDKIHYYRYFHSCGSLAFLNVRSNSKGNRYHCEKCGLVKKSEVELRELCQA